MMIKNVIAIAVYFSMCLFDQDFFVNKTPFGDEKCPGLGDINYMNEI